MRQLRGEVEALEHLLGEILVEIQVAEAASVSVADLEAHLAEERTAAKLIEIDQALKLVYASLSSKPQLALLFMRAYNATERALGVLDAAKPLGSGLLVAPDDVRKILLPALEQLKEVVHELRDSRETYMQAAGEWH